jgi:hypothetical protein
MKWNIEKLNAETQRKEHERIQDCKLKDDGMHRNTEEQQKRIDKVVKEAAEETIRERRNVHKKDWFDEDRRAATVEKNRARQRMLQRETSSNVRKQHQLRSRANKICTKKKKENFRRQYEEAEQLNQQSEMRKF